MPIIDNVNEPANPSDAEAIDKMPRVYKTNAMLYRLTRQDAIRIYKGNPKLTKAEELNIDIALRKYLNERERTTIVTCDFYDFLGEVTINDRAEIVANRKFNMTQDELHEVLCTTLFSYFYNVKYSKIADLKALDLTQEDVNIFSVLSYEELRYLNIMKEEVMKNHRANPKESAKDMIAFAEKIALTGRKSFMKTFGVDPILVQKGEYDCDAVQEVSNRLARTIAKEKASAGEQRSIEK